MRHLPLVLLAACTPVAAPRVASDWMLPSEGFDTSDWAASLRDPAVIVAGRPVKVYTSWAARCGHHTSDGQSHDGSGPNEGTVYAGCHPVAYTATVRCAGPSAAACPTAPRQAGVDGPFDVAFEMELEWKIVPRELGPLAIEVTLDSADGHHIVRHRDFEVVSWDDRRAPSIPDAELEELKRSLSTAPDAPPAAPAE